MNVLKRLTATISASVERAVDQVENHDAIIEAAIKQARQECAKTQSRLSTLRRRDEKLKQQIADAQENIDLWGERATLVAKTNQEQALQCMARRKQCETEIKQLETLRNDHIQLDHELTQNIAKMQQRIQEISVQQNKLRSQQSANEVNQLCNKQLSNESLDSVFERWESSVIAGGQDLEGLHTPVDLLEADFKQSENNAALQAELDLLLMKGENHEDNS